MVTALARIAVALGGEFDSWSRYPVFRIPEEELRAVAAQGITHIVAASSKDPDTAAIERLGMTVDQFDGASSDLATLDAAVESLHAAAMRDDKALIH